MDPYGVQNEEICTRDPSGLAATSPQEGRSFWGRSQARGGVVRSLRGEELCRGLDREELCRGRRGEEIFGVRAQKKPHPGGVRPFYQLK